MKYGGESFYKVGVREDATDRQPQLRIKILYSRIPNIPMDLSAVKRAAVFIVVLLCAILVANTISNVLIFMLGLSGIAGFIAGFVVYAVIFFGVLYLFERFFGISIFHFGMR